jgi:hypothetical protein
LAFAGVVDAFAPGVEGARGEACAEVGFKHRQGQVAHRGLGSEFLDGAFDLPDDGLERVCSQIFLEFGLIEFLRRRLKRLGGECRPEQLHQGRSSVLNGETVLTQRIFIIEGSVVRVPQVCGGGGDVVGLGQWLAKMAFAADPLSFTRVSTT